MTHRTRYGAWGGGATAGDLIIPGNNGGGYPRNASLFIKAHEGSGSDLGDSVSGNDADFSGGTPTWDANRGTFENSGILLSTALAMPDLAANKDYVFFCVVENHTTPSGMDIRIGKGGLGTNYGWILSNTKLTLKTSTASYGSNFGTSIAVGDVVCVYALTDDSAGELYTGYVKLDGTEDNVAVVSGATIATVMTDEIGFSSGTYLYSAGYLEYSEPGPSIATVREAAAWMAVQHTSAECKADPTKRIIYPGL